MTKLYIVTLLLTALAGCANSTAPGNASYGNFLSAPVTAYDQAMADDCVTQLVASFPPASTRFDLRHAMPDVFGKALVESLRAKGYAVLEFNSGARTPDATASPATAPKAAPTTATPRTLQLRYVLDLANGFDLYRVALFVGEETLTRAYLAQNGTVRPAGFWVRKE